MAQQKTFNYGGQAVIEGVMIRGQNSVAVAVRRPDGQIEVEEQPLAAIYRGRLRRWPLLRGVIVLIESLVLGTKALMTSARIASAEEDGEEISDWMLWGTVAVSLVLAVGIFFVIPLVVTNRFIYPHIESAVLANILEGLLRFAVFLLYLYLVGLMPDMRRVFAYHGAEHRVVNGYEAGMPFEVDAMRSYSTAHTRCGTSFLLVVLIIAIIVFALLGKPPLWLGIVSRIVLVPVIAALAYEYIRFGSAHHNNPLVHLLVLPGMALQTLTTREPDDKQVETALSALKKVVESDTVAAAPQPAVDTV